MTVYNGRLYCGTGTCQGRGSADFKYDVGKVFSFEAGRCVSYDEDLGAEWRHIAAVREKDQLKLYVDGKLVSTSKSFDAAAFDLSNDRPLFIGFGQENYFNGSLRDVRIYKGAIDIAEVVKIRDESPSNG
ncbi:MAG: LamG domain-containing protein [Candidatus Hydrogenedentes bacterium]|nr:LamG domain-containing protein [Candidatus Hydrogenedentota bacterium]